ncbi:unnamed protein product [Vitrella brassicaformis CCMP3155]|uniref:Protein kinase domain-containing protein n=1 Tax=Vitrella brassicaformis (strain CCMP3155) TaxID=1169540 RepID=A0A0G4FPN5_VITBC|nr:unnamed protein product [Vitrella brassicaformis CCMP3155]|eukprot:CEM16389.1 unnamed protein product [Vitrella brassicaformis CCMP3155]
MAAWLSAAVSAVWRGIFGPAPIQEVWVDRDTPLGMGPCFPKPHFTATRILGKGVEAAAFLAQRHEDGQMRALRKMANKKRWVDPLWGGSYWIDEFKSVERAMGICTHLQGLDNVVQCHGVYHMAGASFFDLEYLAGGSMYDRCAGPSAIYADHYGRSTVTETLARDWTQQLLNANRGLISRGVYHGDFHASNVMFERPDGNQLKMIDFGHALLFDPKNGNTMVGNSANIVGWPFIHAPETRVPHAVFDADKATVFAIGRLMRLMLCWGWENIRDSSDYAPDVFGRGDLSRDCIELLEAMTAADPNNRPTLADCANHKWSHPHRPARKSKCCC